MKKSIVYLFALTVFLTGCQKTMQNNQVADRHGVPVELKNTDEFPKELAGRWISDKHGWEVIIQETGEISSVVHTIGRFEVEPNKINKFNLVNKGRGIIETGSFKLQYDELTKELIIELELKRFRLQTGDNIVEGRSNDVLIGFISEDKIQWTVEWLSKTHYSVSTDTVNSRELTKPDDFEPHGEVLFRKVVDQD